MKFFTMMNGELKKKAAISAVLIIAAFALIACSSSKENWDADTPDDGRQTMIFHKDGSEWMVKLDNNKITSLYIDDVRIPDEEIPQYENFIYRKIKEFDEDMEDFHAKMDDFDRDMKDFHRDMDNFRDNFEFSFNGRQFSEDMRRAAAEIRTAFDSEEFHANMRELQEELKDIHVDVDIDMDKVHEELRKAGEELKNVKVNVDISHLNAEMARLKEELKDMKVDLKKSSKSLKKFSRFMEDFREELEDDGLIDNSQDDFDMEFNSRELIIDGRKVSDELHAKYKKMFEERTGREMDEDMNIRLNR